MAKNKHLQYLRREARKQVSEALPAMLKPEPRSLIARFIFRIALRIVIATPEK
jgi:hypothetical protein